MRRIEIDIHEYMAAAEAEYRILDSKAEKYFYNQKVRKAYYYADGYDMDDSEMPHSAFLNFSDEEETGIMDVQTDTSHSAPHVLRPQWFTLDGQRLSKRPTQPGLYIHQGKKVVIK